MTEPRDLDPRLREALRATDQDRHDADRIVDAILDGTASSRVDRPPTSGDRRPRWMAPLLAASVAACLALGVGALARLQPQPQHTVAQPGPGVTTSAPTSADLNPIGPQPASGADVGDVSCGADGTIRIATPVVEAQRDGVHLRWTTTAKTTNIGWETGGTAVAAGRHDLTIDAEPGTVTLSCSVTGNEVMSKATLGVLDRTASWLGDRNNLICAGGTAEPSWTIGPVHAATRREAVEKLAEAMGRGQRRPIALGRAPIGYAGSESQTWTIDFSIGPAASTPEAVVVDVRRLGPDRFEAGPNWICMRGKAPAGMEPSYTPQGALPAGTPDSVDLTCTGGRLTASSTTVRARGQGVLFRSTSAAAWTLHWELPTDAVADRPFAGTGATTTEPFPPGTIRLWCGQDRTRSVDLRIVDPDGMYLGGNLEYVCPAITALDTDIHGRGTTAYAAVMDLARVSEPHQTAVVGRAPVGYVTAAQQSWTIRVQESGSSAGLRLTVAQVGPDEDAARFVARPDVICGS